METQVLKTLKRQLAYFLRRFYIGIKTGPSRQHFRTYIQGQLSHLERKTAAAIAQEAGVTPRSLQAFLEIHAHAFARSDRARACPSPGHRPD